MERERQENNKRIEDVPAVACNNDDDFDIDSLPYYDEDGEEYESEEEYKEYKRFARRHDDVDLEEFREFKEYKELHCDDYLDYDTYRRMIDDEESEMTIL